MSDHVTLGRILLVVEPEPTEVEGRVIARVRGWVDDGWFMFVKEVDVFEAERLGLGFFILGLGAFARPEEEKISDDAHVLDAPPLIGGVAFGRWHVVEFVDDGGVDGPDSVSRRISSGKGREHFPDSGME